MDSAGHGTRTGGPPEGCWEGTWGLGDRQSAGAVGPGPRQAGDEAGCAGGGAGLDLPCLAC